MSKDCTTHGFGRQLQFGHGRADKTTTTSIRGWSICLMIL
jgi:hypothetical protein